jgi:DNA-binding CsgD family transcriptional regulator
VTGSRRCTARPLADVQRVLVVHGQAASARPSLHACGVRRTSTCSTPSPARRGPRRSWRARRSTPSCSTGTCPTGPRTWRELLGALDRPAAPRRARGARRSPRPSPTRCAPAPGVAAQERLGRPAARGAALHPPRRVWLPGTVLGPAARAPAGAAAGPGAGPLDVLTDRERDVLRCMVAGSTSPPSPSGCSCRPNTVRTHRRRTLAKLGVHTSLEAVFVARRAGSSPVSPR